MTLTLANGPLAPGAPETVNYALDGPRNKILFSPFPRRVRATFGGETVIDTEAGMLLHESNILPALYVPAADVRLDLATATDHSTHCPYKGDASYWSITVGDRTAENALWGYKDPIESAAWLDGYVAAYWGRLDRWFDEDDEVFGHLRDPYHRVDVRPSSRTVTVTVGGEVVAETSNAKLLSETGLPNRFYIPEADVRSERFEASETASHCPYKGDASYRSLAGSAEGADVAWIYADPFDESRAVAGHWSFDGETVDIRAD